MYDGRADLPEFAGPGIRLPLYGVVVPPGAIVAAYVRSTGPQPDDTEALQTKLVTTLAAGLLRCRAGMGDYVVVLPGHSESVVDNTMLANCVANCTIVGIGQGTYRPTFRWTATGSQWVLDDAAVRISGCRLRLEGANGVVKAINVTGSDVIIDNCDIEVASGAALKATIAIEVGTGADRFQLVNNVLRGTATHNVTDGIKVVAAVNDIRIMNNEMVFSATAGNGNVHFTAAALNLKIARNLMYNTHTASTANIAFDDVAADGFVWDNRLGQKNDGTLTSQGIVFAGTSTLVLSAENYGIDEKQKSGIVTPVVDT